MPSATACLWMVATPLGNIGDLSPRAKDILASSDLILAEDTRRAAALLRSLGLEAKNLTSYFEHNEEEKLPAILARLRAGESIALITDAGTPLMADPGYRLARACRKEGIKVSPVPGPSAPMAALSAAGIAPLPFSFLGFLPRGVKNRQDLFLAFRSVPGSLVFFERNDRLRESLQIAAAILGNRELAICREMTKTHEEFIVGALAHWQDLPEELRGEITVILGPPFEQEKTNSAQVLDIFQNWLNTGLKPRQAAQKTKEQCQGWTSAEIYNLGLRQTDADSNADQEA